MLTSRLPTHVSDSLLSSFTDSSTHGLVTLEGPRRKKGLDRGTLQEPVISVTTTVVVGENSGDTIRIVKRP